MNIHRKLISTCIQLGYDIELGGICYAMTVRWLEACLLGEEAIFLQRIEDIIAYDELALSISKMKEKKGQNLTQDDIKLLDILAFFDSLYLFQQPDKNADLFQWDYNQMHTEAISLIASSTKIQEAGGLIQRGLSLNNYSPKEPILAFFLNDLSRCIDALLLPPDKVTTLLLTNDNHAIGLIYNTKHGWACMDINQYPPKQFNPEETKALADMIFKSFPQEPNINNSININSVILTTKTDFYWPQLNDVLEQLKIQNNSWITTTAVLRGNTAEMMCTAASFGHSAVIAELRNYPVDWHDEAYTPAYLAAYYGHSSIIAELTKHPIDLNQSSSVGLAPIHAAAQEGHPLVVTELAKFNADLNKKTSDGTTAALVAACYGRNSVLTELAKYSVDFNQADCRGLTPAHIAAARGHASVLIELAKHSVDLNKQTKEGVTPAFLAAQYNKAEVLEQLIDLGADCTIPHITTVEKARELAISTEDDAIIVRMELYIEQKAPRRRSRFFDWSFFSCRNQVPQDATISVTPLEIAAIMGYQRIVNILSIGYKPGFSIG